MDTQRESDCFASFLENVAAAVRRSRNTPAVVEEVKSLLRQALCDETFVLDCVDRATITMPARLGSWTNPPIADDNDLEFSIRLIYWPPHFLNSPHEHTFWTVTGVLSNELTFLTYRSRPSSGEPFTVDREIHGVRGSVGSIMPPCIHQVRNPSDSPSISIHIFTGPKKDATDQRNTYERGRTTWYGTNKGAEASQGLDGDYVFQVLISLLSSMINPRSLDLLDRLFELGDLPTRLACAKAISRQDPTRAGRRLHQMVGQCQGEDAIRLRAIADSLVQGDSTI